MKGLYRVFEFYINSSVHVSLAVVSLAAITYLSLDIIFDYRLLAFVFFASITGYNFVKYAAVAGMHHRSLARSLRHIQIFSFFCAIGMLYFSFWLSPKVLISGAFFGILTLLYAIPIFSRKRNLRKIKGVKIYAVALVWTGATVVLPLLNGNELPSWDGGIIAIQRFLFVLVLTLPFELRDLQYDAAYLRTIPQQVGVRKTKLLGVGLLLGLLLLEFMKDEVLQFVWVSTILMALLTALTLMGSDRKKSMYFASFWVEGLPLVWLAILLGLSSLLT